MSEVHRKVTAGHLSRDAYLYVRQSTVRQVYENTESTRRQYALRERAVALGWPDERVVVIDTDLGPSGADRDRDGFQRLVAEVGMGRAGIVLGLEVSRLARNSTDWHRLLEICALSDTLILDEDGVYDPGDFNDRLLLGLKGTMSEAELHMPHARLRGGLLNRARRGALKLPLPVGLVYDPLDRVALDPDAQVPQSPRMLFDTFARTGSATATVRHFRGEGLHFPRRLRGGARKGELHWQPLEHSLVLRVLHNPRYAGAYAFGRSRQRRRAGGVVEWRRVPIGEWTVLLRDAHPGYIAWDRFEANQRRPRDNALARGADRRRGPPREGPALLRGLALCGVCGRGMTIRYHVRRGRQVPDYVCQRDGIRTAGAKCQSIPGAGIDLAIGALLVELMTPVTLTVALKVRDELAARADEADVWRAQAVERAREEAELARRRFNVPIPTTGSWPMSWRPSGTPGCALWTTPAGNSSSGAPKTPDNSTTPGANASCPWPPTSRACGTIRRPRTASASAWRDCRSTTSPSRGAPRSRLACACAAGRRGSCGWLPNFPRDNGTGPPSASSHGSTACSTAAPTRRSRPC